MMQPTVCPSTLQAGYSTYSERALNHLFDGKKVSHVFGGENPITESNESKTVLKSIGRISLSGAQPKFSVIIGEEGRLRFALKGEQGRYILKPKPTGYHIINKEYCAANEHLTMQLASQIYGIETAPNGLCFFENDGSMAYITKRFDVGDNEKYPQEDFAALMGFSRDTNGSEYKYIKGSYEECGEIIRKYVNASIPDLRKFFRIILFNFITLNDDAHLKNFSLVEREGEYHLSPAYDLINTSLQIWEPRIFALDNGLFKEGMQLTDTRIVNRKDFEEFGRRIGLPKKIIDRDIEMFLVEYPEAEAMINRSFLSDQLKQDYYNSYDFRRKILTF